MADEAAFSFRRYYSPAEIAEMRAAGYSAEIVAECETRSAKAWRVMAQIEEAFVGVKLEDGVGLEESNGLDDYADEATLQRLRTLDEREDWHRIPPAKMTFAYGGLSFMDAKGMRFHLPAYLLAHLRDEADDPIFHLTGLYGRELSDFARAKFDLFTKAQREAVQAYLELVLASGEYEYERVEIEQALADYWRQPAPTQQD